MTIFNLTGRPVVFRDQVPLSEADHARIKSLQTFNSKVTSLEMLGESADSLLEFIPSSSQMVLINPPNFFASILEERIRQRGCTPVYRAPSGHFLAAY